MKQSHSKGCGANSCGFCGPRLADDWARAITAAQPNLKIRLPISPEMPWTSLRKRVNRLVAGLRELHSGLEAAWWVEGPPSAKAPTVWLLARAPDLSDTGAAWRMSVQRFPGANFDVSWSGSDRALWLWLFQDRALEFLRHGIYEGTYGQATQRMKQHLLLNGNSGGAAELVHTTAGFFGTSRVRSGRRRTDALSRTSPWRNRPGGNVQSEWKQSSSEWPATAARDWNDEVWRMPSNWERVSSERSVSGFTWHDEVWWRTHEEYALRRGLDLEGEINPFARPEWEDPEPDVVLLEARELARSDDAAFIESEYVRWHEDHQGELAEESWSNEARGDGELMAGGRKRIDESAFRQLQRILEEPLESASGDV